MAVQSSIKITSPCSKKWDELSGEGIKRYCDTCSLYVSDLTQKTDQEIVELIERSGGRFCGKVRQSQLAGISENNRYNAFFMRALMLFSLSFATVVRAEAQERKLLPVPVQSTTQVASVNTEIYADSLAENSIIIKGTVYSVDEDEPLFGVNVFLKGTGVGTITDIHGRYTLVLPDSLLSDSELQTIVFTYIGFENREVTVNTVNALPDELSVYLKTDIPYVLGAVVGGISYRSPFKRAWLKIKGLFRNRRG